MKKFTKLLSLLICLVLAAVLIFGGSLQDVQDALGSSSDTVEAPVTALPENTEPVDAANADLDENGTYTSRDDVALYIHTYNCLPSNFITKDEAKKAGWEGGSLEPYFPGMCIGGDRFGNREGLLPESEGRVWTECDINTLGQSSRGAERLVFSNDGLIYYTGDHYESFQLLYGET